MIELIKKPAVLKACGISKSTLHTRINSGLFPAPISIGARAVAWPSHEVESINNALIAGKTNEEIKTLVKVLVSKRTQEVA